MPLRKIAKTWYLDDYINGKRVRKKLSENRDVAKRIREEMLKKADLSRFGIASDNNSLPKDLKQHFMEELRPRLSANTLEGYDAMISQALQHIGTDVPLHQIRHRMNEYFSMRQAQGISGRTLNKTLELLKRMLSYGVETQAIAFNPLAGVPKVKEIKRPRRPLTPEEIKALLEHSRKWRLVWLTFILTGLRKSELVQLRWKDLDTEACTLTVRRSKTDAGMRTIPLHETLLRELRPLQRKSKNPEEFVFTTVIGTPLRNNLLTRFRECLRRAGIDREGVDIHALRYTFTSLMERAGRPIKQTQKLTGHKSALTTLDIYARAYDKDLRDAINTIVLDL